MKGIKSWGLLTFASGLRQAEAQSWWVLTPKEWVLMGKFPCVCGRLSVCGTHTFRSHPPQLLNIDVYRDKPLLRPGLWGSSAAEMRCVNWSNFEVIRLLVVTATWPISISQLSKSVGEEKWVSFKFPTRKIPSEEDGEMWTKIRFYSLHPNSIITENLNTYLLAEHTLMFEAI